MIDTQTIEQLIQANHAAIQQAIDTNAGPDDWAKIEDNIQKQIKTIRGEIGNCILNEVFTETDSNSR